MNYMYILSRANVAKVAETKKCLKYKIPKKNNITKLFKTHMEKEAVHQTSSYRPKERDMGLAIPL